MHDDAQKSEPARRPIPVRVSLNHPTAAAAPRPAESSGASGGGHLASGPPATGGEDAGTEPVQQGGAGVPEASANFGTTTQDPAPPEVSIAEGAVQSPTTAGAEASPVERNGEPSGEAVPARRRPTPVREALGQAGGAGGAGGAESATSRLETLRHFQIDGQAWTARVAGRAVGGTGCGPPARLMAIDFFRAENPDQPVSRAVLQGRDLDALFDEEIVALFTHAAAVEKGTEQRKEAHRGADGRRRRSGRPERGF